MLCYVNIQFVFDAIVVDVVAIARVAQSLLLSGFHFMPISGLHLLLTVRGPFLENKVLDQSYYELPSQINRSSWILEEGKACS